MYIRIFSGRNAVVRARASLDLIDGSLYAHIGETSRKDERNKNEPWHEQNSNNCYFQWNCHCNRNRIESYRPMHWRGLPLMFLLMLVLVVYLR